MGLNDVTPRPAQRCMGIWFATAAAVMALLAPGCRVQPRNFQNANDKLRKENLALRQQVTVLQNQISEHQAKSDALRHQLEAVQQTDEVTRALLPKVTQIDIGRFSGWIDTDGDGRVDTLRLYVRLLDQRGRFLVSVGRATVQTVSILSGQPPRVPIEVSFPPKAFDGFYRSGPTGSHYTLEVPVPGLIPEGVTETTVKITFTDADTGKTLTRQMPMAVPSRARAIHDPSGPDNGP